jgi:hypothetical protein
MRPTPYPLREKQPLLFKNTDGAIGRTDPFVGIEKKTYGLLDLLVGVKDDSVIRTIDQSYGQRRFKFAATSFTNDATTHSGFKVM